MITPQEYADYVNQLSYLDCPDFQTKINLLHEFIKAANTIQLKEAIRLTAMVKSQRTLHHYENLLTTLDIKRAEESAQAVERHISHTEKLTKQTETLITEAKNLNEQNKILVSESKTLGRLTWRLFWLTVVLALLTAGLLYIDWHREHETTTATQNTK